MASEVVEAKINWSVLLTLQAIYEQMDWDKNGSVSFVEFKSYLSKLKKGEDFDHQEALLAFKSIDSDGSKQLTWDEFFVSSCTFQASFLARKFKFVFPGRDDASCGKSKYIVDEWRWTHQSFQWNWRRWKRIHYAQRGQKGIQKISR